MKRLTPMKTLRNTVKQESLGKTSCWIDDIQVQIKECSLELESNVELSDLYFWGKEFKELPRNSN